VSKKARAPFVNWLANIPFSLEIDATAEAEKISREFDIDAVWQPTLGASRDIVTLDDLPEKQLNKIRINLNQRYRTE
jgi:hypothetical protein